MQEARIRLEHMMDREGPINRWVLDCPHGRWFADQRAENSPATKAAVIRGVLLPSHDKEHDGACTRDLWAYYGPGGAGWDEQ